MGLSTAQLLWSHGYSLALIDLSQPSLDSVVSSFESSASKVAGQKVFAKAANVSSTAALKEVFKEAQEKLGGRIEGVAHLAGILGGMGPVHEQSEDGE